MSYKIKNAKFLNSKINIENFNFTTDKNNITQVIITDQNNKKDLKRIFKGKEQVVSGRFLIDGLDLVNPKFVRDHSSFIYTDKYLERFIPSKIILVLSSLFDVNFMRNARINHLRTKYDYLNYVSSKTKITELNLKNKLDKTISEFIDKEMKNEVSTLKQFQKQIIEFNEKKSDEIYENKNQILKIVSRSYYKEVVQLELYEIMLTFLQVMWDSIYNFDNLRNSCTCEYNAKKSSNKVIRKLNKDLNYNQTKYVVKKQLRYLNIKITEHRTLIFKQKRLVKQLKKQFDFETRKHIEQNKLDKNEASNIQKQVHNWEKVLKDQTEIFTKNQQNYFFNTLQENALYAQKLVIVSIHKYHQKVLGKTTKFGSIEEYKKAKKYYKNKIISIYKQAYQHNINQMKEFDIKMEWFLKSTFKLSSLNILMVKILTSINLGKKNIFLMDFTHLLSPTGFKKMVETLNLIKQKRPGVNFIILDSHPNKLPDLSQEIYGLYGREFVNKKLSDFIDKNPKDYRSYIFNNRNTFKYIFKDGIIKVYNRKFKYNNPKLKENGFVFINPFKMRYENSADYDNNRIAIITDIKQANNFNDPNMYYCKNEKGYKFYFYDNQKYNLSSVNRAIITFDLDSIAEFI